ncbi:MAG: hypothetical protein Q4G30_07345 [Actinomycetaceae bacterium]|nr:hypothetical protein [Actinomycetaceae bacterium]
MEYKLVDEMDDTDVAEVVDEVNKAWAENRLIAVDNPHYIGPRIEARYMELLLSHAEKTGESPQDILSEALHQYFVHA